MFTPHLGPGETVPAQAAQALAQADKAGLQRSSPGPAGQAQGVTPDGGLLKAGELQNLHHDNLNAAASRVPVSVPDLSRSAQQLAKMLEEVGPSLCKAAEVQCLICMSSSSSSSSSSSRLATQGSSWLPVLPAHRACSPLLQHKQPLTQLALLAGGGAQGAPGPGCAPGSGGALPDLLAASAGSALQEGRCQQVPGSAPGHRLGCASLLTLSWWSACFWS